MPTRVSELATHPSPGSCCGSEEASLATEASEELESSEPAYATGAAERRQSCDKTQSKRGDLG